MTFENVTAIPKANLYFDGRVVSHGIVTANGEKKTFGVIFPGEYFFGTEAAERMDVIDGTCEVVLKDSEEKKTFKAGDHFNVPANSGFTITVAEGTAEYICSFIEE